MSIPDIRPETIALINWMTGAAPINSSLAAEPIDLAWIDPLALGDLWTAAHETAVSGCASAASPCRQRGPRRP